MPAAEVVDLRAQLLDWRQKLETSIAAAPAGGPHLARLLRELDLTLERIGEGEYGMCEVCEEPIGREQLSADPLARFCLSCFTPAELGALQRDLELAREIQGGLLPKLGSSPSGDWEVGYHYEAAGPVGGDFCDLVRVDGDILFLLGDASGKGIAASVLMAHLHAIFRSLITLKLPVLELVTRANQIFCDFNMAGYYATLVCGLAGREGGVELCNAGHCPPLLVRGGEVSRLGATGLPVGMFESGEFGVERLRLEPGDTLFLYTDGLTEACDGREAEYGVERLSGLLGRHHASPVQTLIDTCVGDLRAYGGGAHRKDDLTIMAIRRTS